MRRRFFLLMALALGAVLVLFPLGTFARVWTDQADYTPGSVVTIGGDNSDGAAYAPGETVHVDVSGPNGYMAACEGVADDAGAWSCQVALAADESAVGEYTYTSIGLSSGATESGTFTDGNGPGGANNPSPSNDNQGQNGTTLSAEKTATAHWTQTFHWTIDKSVVPDTLNMFRGDSGSVDYTIAVTKDAGTVEAYVDGQVCVTNGGGVATENLQIVDNLTMPPSQDVIASVNVDTSANPVLDPGESFCYPYHVDIPAASIVAGATYKDTADITITNHSGHLGTPFGPGPSATSPLPASPTPVNDTINVDDTNGGSWLFNGSGSQTYFRTFACDADAGEHDNTATIRETGQSDSATVTVNCYELNVTKDASTSFERTYHWSIDKSADQSALTLEKGQTFLVNYSVKVEETFTDGDFAVAGNISVHNPAPIAATINAVSDIVSGVGSLPVDCGVAFPYALAAGGTLDCAYSGGLPEATSRINTATATLQNTPGGTTDFSGSANVAFDSAPTTEVDKCITVSDTLQGSLGTVCAGDAPMTFTYSRYVGPYSSCGEFTVDNTASFVTNTTGTTGESSWTVNVTVPCGGCTLTIGYWKTHAGGVGHNADMVTDLLPIWLGTAGGAKSVQVTSASQAISLLSMSGDPSNGINKLYAQLLGARLNIAAGADGAAVASTISAADGFLATRNAADWNSLTKPQRAQVLSWAATLDNYNNGLIGPGHCSQ